MIPTGTDWGTQEGSMAQSQSRNPIPRGAGSNSSSRPRSTGPLGSLGPIPASKAEEPEFWCEGKRREGKVRWVTQLSPVFKSQTYQAVSVMPESSPVSLLTLGDTPTTLSFLPKPLSPVTKTLNTSDHSRSEKWSGERGGGGSYSKTV